MYMDDIKLFAKNEKELETLIHTVRIYSQDIGMEFGIEKCAMLVMKSGKRLLETKLSCRNLIKGINTWAVDFVRYSGPFLKWTRDELK